MNSQTEKAPRLTVTEKRAAAFCASLVQFNGGNVSVDWIKSATWGMNPRIVDRGGKCSNISGCGYCKLSACLAQVLRFLFPINSAAYSEVWGTSGAGESSVMSALAKHGWTLTKNASGKTYDVYTLTKTEPVNA